MVAQTEDTTTHGYPTNGNGHGDMADNGLSFEELLGGYIYDQPYRGQILEGVILVADDHEIMVDVGLKRDAFVPRADLERLDDELLRTLTPGVHVTTYVMQPSNADGDLIVSINKGLELRFWDDMKRSMEANDTLDVEIVGTNRGGLLARYNRLTGFIPMSQVTSVARFTSDHEMQEAKTDLVDRKLQVKIIEVDRLNNRLIFSERAARGEARKVRMSELEIGMDVDGVVVGLVDFGAFVDIGGVDGLVHISKLDHKFVTHPGEVLKIGDEVRVRIESIDTSKQRISLNRKVLLPDPWTTLSETFHEGQVIDVRVSNVADFGVFAVMDNGLQGLIHTSNIQSLGAQNLHNFLREGVMMKARIINIDTDRQRIGLSVDDVPAEEQPEHIRERQSALPAAAEPAPAEDVPDAPAEPQADAGADIEASADADVDIADAPEAEVEA